MRLVELQKLVAKGEAESLEFKKPQDNDQKLLKQYAQRSTAWVDLCFLEFPIKGK